LSDRAAQRNNERPVVEPKTTTVIKQVGSDVNQADQTVAAENDRVRNSGVE